MRRSGRQEWLPPTRRGAAPPPPPVAIVAAANDSVTFSDSAAAAQDFIAIAADTITFADSCVGGLSMLAAANDSVTFDDSAEGQAIALFGVGEDTITFSDSSVSTSARIASASDFRTPTDSALAVSARVATGSDTLSLTDSAVGGDTGNPYLWDDTFDLDQLPFEASDPVQVAQPPGGTLVDVAVSTEVDLAAALYTRYRRITFTGRIQNSVFNDGDIRDVHLILADGALLKDPNFGSFDGSRTIERFLISHAEETGSPGTVGVSGQLHHATFFGPATDVVFDGVIHSGPAGNSGALIFNDTAGGVCDRIAINFGLAACGGYFYIGTFSNFTMVRTSVRTGLDTATPAESWGVRNSWESTGNIVGFQNDIRSNPLRTNNSHHRWRIHPTDGLLNYWLGYSTLIDRVQSRIFWCNAAAGSGSGRINRVYLQNNLIIATTTDPTDPPPSIEIQDADEVYVNFNTFQSPTFLSPANFAISGALVEDTDDNGFTGSAPADDPSWGGAGDPDDIDWTPTV